MIRFRKLYARVEEGVSPNAIISYMVVDSQKSVKIVHDHYEDRVLSRRHRLIVDLWVAVYVTDWTRDVKE